MQERKPLPHLKSIAFCVPALCRFLGIDTLEEDLALFTENLDAGIAPDPKDIGALPIHSSIHTSQIPSALNPSLSQDREEVGNFTGHALQYLFSDGSVLFADQILYHPNALRVPNNLLPFYGNAKSYLKYYFLNTSEDANRDLLMDSLFVSVLLNASELQEGGASKLQIWLTPSLNPFENRPALQLKTIETIPLATPCWTLRPVEDAGSLGKLTLLFDPPANEGHILFKDFELAEKKRALFFHPYERSVAIVNNHLHPLRSKNNADLTHFNLEGHRFISALVQELNRSLVQASLAEMRPLSSRTILSSDVNFQIWLASEGSIQFCRQLKSLDVNVWNFPTSLLSLANGLNYGLSATFSQKHSALVQVRRGIKRDRDLKVLRHVGFFSYLVFETATFINRFSLVDVIPERDIQEFLVQLMGKLGKLLYEIERKAGLISLSSPQLLDHLCSTKVIESIHTYVYLLIQESKTGTDSIFTDEGEIQIRGGFNAILQLLRALLHKVAAQSKGACFLKARLGLFSGLLEKDKVSFDEISVESTRMPVVASGNIHQAYLLSNAWLPAKGILHALLSLRTKGFEIFYENLPLGEMDMSEFKAEFRLSESEETTEDPANQGTIDWFELHPQFFFKGIEIDPAQLKRLSHEGVLEFQGKIFLIQNKNLPSVKRLEHFWSKIQSISQGPLSRKRGDSFLKLPKSQILEMLALRASGVSVVGQSERWIKICEFYDALNQDRPNLIIPPTVHAELKDYQHRGVRWLLDLYELGLGGILADDMGLGKTIQTLAFLEVLRTRNELGLVLIVVPTSLTYNWITESKKFTPEIPMQIFQSKLRDKILENMAENKDQVLICTYGLFTEHQELLEKQKWNILIFDEAQHLKNITAKRTTASRSISAHFKFCLTGTPLENHLGEFYSLVDLVVSGSLGDLSTFRTKFVTPESLNLEDVQFLKLKIRPLVLRRTKNEVLAELPPKMETTIKLPFEKKQEKIYRDIALSWNEKVKDSILNQGEAKSQLLMLTALLRLRQACSDPGSIPNVRYTEDPPKMTILIEALNGVAESGESALVFTQFLYTFERIKNQIAKHPKIKLFCLHGGTSRTDREKILKGFQESAEGAVLLMTLKTGGVGLNLTKASYVFHLEPWWNPAVEDQATDRTYRIGQQKPVQVYRYLMRESVEEKIEILKARKSAKFNALFSSSENESELISASNHLSQADFEYLLSP